MTLRRWGKQSWGLAALSMLAWALRLPPILDNRLHPDEALYGYWSFLIGCGRDPWLTTMPVYKPPLLPYLIAGSQALFGNSEFAVRLPGLAAGLLTVVLVAALARSLYRDRWAATIAAVSVALSPFAILFSATAFTDPLMVALGLGGCVAATRGRPAWAGLLAGLAVATKQTGLVWLPLVALLQIPNPKSPILTWTSQNQKGLFSTAPPWNRRCWRFNPAPALSGRRGLTKPPQNYCPLCKNLIGKVLNPRCLLLVIGHWSLVILLVFGWDGIRVAHGADSFWRVGVAGYGGLRLIWPQELWERLRGWVGLMRYLFASSLVNGALLVGLPVLLWRAVTHRRHTREALTDLLLISFLLTYFLLHWLWAFPVWDRYLLPLAPVLSLLLARTLTIFASHFRSLIAHRSWLIANCSLFILLILPAWNAAHSRYPVGGDHGAYDGIDEVAAFLRDLPAGAVVYQHWLGWQYAYYLFDGPVYLAYWPTPTWLAQDVQVFGATDLRYITFPSWESSARVERALADVGYGLAPVLTTTRRDGTHSFTVYHVRLLSDQ